MLSVHCLCLLLAMCLGVSLALESFMAEDDYEVFPTVPGSRFKLYSSNITWPEALSICQGDGGGSHLVIINSQDEADVVREMFARIPSDPYYIYGFHVGINDIATEGTWLTVLGAPVTTSGYNVWEPGQPNEGVNANCGGATRGPRPMYFDIPCTIVKLPFICEKTFDYVV